MPLKSAIDAWNTVISLKWTLLFCICFHNYRCQIAWFTRFQLTPESYKITFIWINGTQTRSQSNQEKHVGSIKYSRSCKISSFPSPPFFRNFFIFLFLLYFSGCSCIVLASIQMRWLDSLVCKEEKAEIEEGEGGVQ